MKDIFEKWDKELDSKMTRLRQDVLDEPIPTKPFEIKEAKKKKPIFKYMSIACSIAAVIVLCICIIPLLRSGTDPQLPPSSVAPNTPGGTVIVPLQGETSMITVEINPRTLFIIDKDGKVTDAVATNEDADVVIMSEGFDEAVIGKGISDAIVNYVDFVSRLGYIDTTSEDSQIKITANESESGKKALSGAKEKLQSHLSSIGAVTSIVDKTATVEEICELNGLDRLDKIEKVVDKISSESPFFSDRTVGALDEEELVDYYKDVIKGTLRVEVTKSLQMAYDVLELTRLNEAIWYSTMFWGDYWALVGSDLTIKGYELLEEYVAKMGEKLSAFKENYGIEITGSDQLISLAYGLSEEWLKGIENSLEKLDGIEEYKKLFDHFGKETDIFEKLDKTPTRDEVLEEKKNFIKEQNSNRLDKSKGEKPSESQPSDEPKGEPGEPPTGAPNEPSHRTKE
ncbi:MAG: hypothetical protein IJX02_04615 [Clostridia bacterium]|nr:hypothetical protein [Clostridia bacterium]